MEMTKIDEIRKQLLMWYSDDSLRTAQRAMVDTVITKEEYKIYEEAYQWIYRMMYDGINHIYQDAQDRINEEIKESVE